jgi:predicted lipoprotein with Yx(FWY)xxD motif
MIASLAAIAVTLMLTACGSSSSEAGSSGSSLATNSSATKKSTAATKQARSGAAVTTAKVPGYGTVLATGHGAPLYLLTADPSGGSSCSGGCAKQWPPLKAGAKPKAGAGVSQSLLSSFERADGSAQVSYAGHALYTHPGTTASAVAGTAADGGIWYLVSPSGKPIKSTNGSGY